MYECNMAKRAIQLGVIAEAHFPLRNFRQHQFFPLISLLAHS